MLSQLRRLLRFAAPRQIVRAGDGHPGHLPQPTRHPRRILQMTNAHRDVQPLVNQVQVAIVEDHFNLHLRIPVKKRHHHRCHMLTPELHRRGNTQ
ncbi:hypothetical protein D3C87_1962840 [compost metagenome]